MSADNQNGDSLLNESAYTCGYLEKKEDGNKWIKYWVALQDGRLKLHTHEPHNAGDPDAALMGWIELTHDTNCCCAKKKGNNFPFYLEKPGKRYLFKTQNAQSRDQWIEAINASIYEKNNPLQSDVLPHLTENPLVGIRLSEICETRDRILSKREDENTSSDVEYPSQETSLTTSSGDAQNLFQPIEVSSADALLLTSEEDVNDNITYSLEHSPLNHRRNSTGKKKNSLKAMFKHSSKYQVPENITGGPSEKK